MGYYDDPENVEAYVKMAAGYDGRELIEVLKLHLPAGSTVLELGMGPGVDLDILSQTYEATGSDMSPLFIDRYRKLHPAADTLLLDAVTIKTDKRFDCIYSNKVLHHLTANELRQSFLRQAEIVNPGGILMHSFWYGDHEEQMHGMRFTYYTEDTLMVLLGEEFQLLEMVRYQEMDPDDSLYLVLKRTVT